MRKNKKLCRKGRKNERKQLEIDFVANKGNQRYYIQSAYDIPNEQKMQQETKSFNKIDDSCKYRPMRANCTAK